MQLFMRQYWNTNFIEQRNSFSQALLESQKRHPCLLTGWKVQVTVEHVQWRNMSPHFSSVMQSRTVTTRPKGQVDLPKTKLKAWTPWPNGVVWEKAFLNVRQTRELPVHWGHCLPTPPKCFMCRPKSRSTAPCCFCCGSLEPRILEVKSADGKQDDLVICSSGKKATTCTLQQAIWCWVRG